MECFFGFGRSFCVSQFGEVLQLDVGDSGPIRICCVQADSQFAFVHDDIFYRRIREQGSAVVHFHFLVVARETSVSINRSEGVC